MKVTRHWLNQWIPIEDIATQDLADKLTGAGLEVDSFESLVETDLANVVVAEIQSCEPHPQADRLTVCQVSDGVETTQVVCGAANACVGLKTAFARVGAVLPKTSIKASELRGVLSEGMLCSLADIGLAQTSEGLLELPEDTPLGALIFDVLSLKDEIIDIDLTPNRGDCFSVLGIARELAVAFDRPLQMKSKPHTTPSITVEQTVNIIAKPVCPRYLGCVLTLDDMPQTPLWLQERLRRVGLCSTNLVVDALNFIMWDLGQPLHAFDLDKVQGAIQVRKAHLNEKLTVLDETCLELSDDDLVIADDNGPLALAGVMGGLDSRVTETTRRIFIESAYFDPPAIARSSQRHMLQTDAAQRFARGVDFNLPEKALTHALVMLEELLCAKAGVMTRVEHAEYLPRREEIHFSTAFLSNIGGIELNESSIIEKLTALGMKLGHEGAGLYVTPPSYRFDIAIAEDLAEEVLRLTGYDTIPAQPLHLEARVKTQFHFNEAQLKTYFADRDYHETVTYSFISEKLARLFHPDQFPLALQNPITRDLAVMRDSLWPSLLLAAQHNLKRQQHRIRLFEFGHRYYRDHDHFLETNVVAGLALGSVYEESWDNAKRHVDFFDVKGDVESVLAQAGIAGVSFTPGEHQALHPGQTAGIVFQERIIGHIGLLHPQLKQALGLKQAVYLFQFDLAVFEHAETARFEPMSKFPAIRRDLALIVDEKITSFELLDCIRKEAGTLLLDTFVFDVYTGEGIGKGLKSIAIGLILQDSCRTLIEEDIAAIMTRVIAALKSSLGAQLRDGE